MNLYIILIKENLKTWKQIRLEKIENLSWIHTWLDFELVVVAQQEQLFWLLEFLAFCNRSVRHSLLSLIHISEPTRQEAISYAVFCLKKKTEHSIPLYIPRSRILVAKALFTPRFVLKLEECCLNRDILILNSWY